MAAKACKGCQQNFEVYDKESRRVFSLHINNCQPYQDMREAQFADQNRVTQEQKDNTFIHILYPQFDDEKARAILEAVKFYMES